MDLIKSKDFSFSYSPDEKILSNLNLTIKRGNFVLLCGPSGSGKTTLLMNLKNEIKPIGKEEGVIYYNGEDIRQLDKEKSAREIGFLFQNPENQFVCDNVIQEISFSLENIGASTEEIRTRVAEMSTFFGLDKILYKKIDELSGGQKQLVNLSSLLILKPKFLLLDEPTSHLDPIASYDFLSILRRLNEEFSMTILVTEHRIDNIFPLIDQAIFIENGKIIYNNSPREVCIETWDNNIFSNYLPSTVLVHFLFKKHYSFIENNFIPINIRESLNDMYDMNQQLLNKTNNTFYDEYLELNHIKSENSTKNNNENKIKSNNENKIKSNNENKIKSNNENKIKSNNENKIKSNNENKIKSIFECKNLWFAYNKNNIIIKDISFEIKKGEFISILGGNGTGKSTLLQLLTKILKPLRGKINYSKETKLAYVHQNPMMHFTCETVTEEFGIALDLYEERKLIKFFEIESILNKHPYDCSGGEQQKIAIIKSLLSKPDILFLDEPTKGLDPIFKKNLGEKFKELQKKGLTIIMATHDVDFAADFTNRSFLIFNGAIQVDNTPKEFFHSNNFYTTFVNRMVKNYIPKCVTLSDLKEIWNDNIN